MRRICAAITIVSALVCTVGSAAPPALSASGAAAIDRMFQAAVDKGEIPGVVAAVTNKDRDALPQGLRQAGRRAGRADVQGHGVPHRLDDQADHVGRR